jgi:hypothetical protein
MSTPDYPLLTVPGYELYQLAHLTTFAVDALARHRRAAKAREHPDRQDAAAVETRTDATDRDPTPVNPSPSGFAAAAAALSSSGATPPHSPTTGTRHSSMTARPGPAAATRPAPSPRQTPAP